MEFERSQGRQPKDVRYAKASADIQSPPWLIEVKATGTSFRVAGFLLMEATQIEEARRNPDFFLYLVENIRQGNPALFSLKVLGGAQLRRLVDEAKERRYYEVPPRVAEYDSLPGREAGRSFRPKGQNRSLNGHRFRYLARPRLGPGLLESGGIQVVSGVPDHHADSVGPLRREGPSLARVG